MFIMLTSEHDFEVKRLQREIDNLTTTVSHLESRIKAQNEALNDEVRSSEFSVDWQRMRAFSIERMFSSDGLPVTVIGYILESNDKDPCRQWYLHCNDATHRRLVEEFNTYRSQL